MYIKIGKEQEEIPRITINKNNQSNVIKKSEVSLFHESKALLIAIKEQVNDYQSILEGKTLKLIAEKEQLLNEYVDKKCEEITEEFLIDQNKWFESAKHQLSELIEEQKNELYQIKKELKVSIINIVNSRISKLKKNEKIIEYLIEILHAEIDDEEKKISVDQTYQEDGVILTIENEDRIISINTATLINELRAELKKL
ncbi:hypothetical protein [Photobacterium leiognathi]|uniref:hypothetical protein n=1 Tax=Photobacterium leiognathi TaxID=553611 RepID=UPI0029818B65|nr:hypothetical protein [Photobacterium leiognathi]